MKNEKGITLIALIITVVVMLILAGVAISVLTSDGGLFDKTRRAAEAYENAAQREAEQITDLISESEKFFSGISSKPSDPKTNGSWNGKVNTPRLATGMTAIYWNEDGEEVELTSSSSKSEWNKWYSYTAQTGTTETPGSGTSKWANAVTKDKNGNITGYWVWIPRYEYKLTPPASGETAGTIEVNFISTNTTTSSSSEYKVHPAFISDPEKGGWDKELPGFWVAKYPAGYQARTVDGEGKFVNASDKISYSNLQYKRALYGSADSTRTRYNPIAQLITTRNNNPHILVPVQNISYPVFKPLTYTYNLIDVDSAFRIALDIKNNIEFYGLLNTTDTHLMKNSEWGAVAYLAWSQYGRNATEPNINNVVLQKSKFLTVQVTGIVATSTDASSTGGSFTGNTYNTAIGQLGSTTGNITGVYDMNGCVREYVAAYIVNNNGIEQRSEFGAALTSDYSEKKYKNIYPANNNADNEDGNYEMIDLSLRYGDAIKETSKSGRDWHGSWNNDSSTYAYNKAPFFSRGGCARDGGAAGLFTFGYFTMSDNGDMDYDCGFRVCLIPDVYTTSN